jgi:hypothetical protein
MLRKNVIAIVASAVIVFEPAAASARGGFGGGGFHGRGFGGGGWRGGGWGAGWRGPGWRGGGWGWRGPAVGALGVGVGLGLAGAYGGWGPGWGWGGGWSDPCVRRRQVWTGWGWRVVPVNVCLYGESSEPADHFRIARQAVPLPPAKIAGPQPAGEAAVASEPARVNVTASPVAGGAAGTSNARTVQEQVAAATSLAEHVTAASAGPVPQGKANSAEASGRSKAAQPSDTEPTASVPTNNTDNLVALLMVRPEIKSVSDLTGKDIAIQDQQSASSASIRTAIAAAGAAEVRLNAGHTKAIDRLTGGEVPAAVLTLVSPEGAEWFPDIPGYRILRVPLSPHSSKARL